MRPPAKGWTRELQVGLFLFTACLVIVAFSFRITNTPMFVKGTEVVTYFKDATGIYKNTQVKMAGIAVGVIKDIQLDNGRAKITMLINEGIAIPANSKIIPRPMGILGDRYLEVFVPIDENDNEGILHEPSKGESPPHGFWNWLFPQAYAQGTNSVGAPPVTRSKKSPNIVSGGVIQAEDRGATIDQVTEKLGVVATDIQEISATVRKLLTGKDSVDSPIGRTVKNLENLTSSVNEILNENRKEVRGSVQSAQKVIAKIENIIDSFNEGQLKRDLKELGLSAGNLGRSLKNLEEVTAKVNEGHGTLGRLINDPALYTETTHAVTSFNKTFRRISQTQISVLSNVDYLTRNSVAKATFGLQIAPSEETGYLLHAIIGSSAKEKKSTEKTRINDGAEVKEDKTFEDHSAFRVSVEFYKRIWSSRFRLGVIESSGGIGFDQYFLRDHWKWQNDLYALGERKIPILRSAINYKFLNYFQARLGVDDLLKKQNVFAGVGIEFLDDDIPSLLVFGGL